MAIENFEIGRTYNRRRDVHARYGGQQQGGIITPSRHPLIFAITGTSGRQHGYEDRWEEDGSFRYFGEGQTGDMKWERGNKAIRDHATDGRELLLFEIVKSGLRFQGAFNCAGFSYELAPDREANQRQAIVFHLVPLPGDVGTGAEEHPEELAVLALSLNDLRGRAFAAAGPAREVKGDGGPSTYYARSRAVRAYVLCRAAGKCERCGNAAPFNAVGGAPYLEPHHIRRLSDQGPDDPRHMAGLCPNCHREAHYGELGRTLNRHLQQMVAAKEVNLDGMLSE